MQRIIPRVDPANHPLNEIFAREFLTEYVNRAPTGPTTVTIEPKKPKGPVIDERMTAEEKKYWETYFNQKTAAGTTGRLVDEGMKTDEKKEWEAYFGKQATTNKDTTVEVGKAFVETVFNLTELQKTRCSLPYAKIEKILNTDKERDAEKLMVPPTAADLPHVTLTAAEDANMGSPAMTRVAGGLGFSFATKRNVKKGGAVKLKEEKKAAAMPIHKSILQTTCAKALGQRM
ncbi:hypothetical protein SAICODRAFT_22782 [Saitoella complicata NRRL Y-17804]|uniref:uncharacterized protein n=1 Tax=Saitoella complicata (strain BCRC 22490 / CBS 7301 / JCM 7358 / NBRC 10748 / NRRL Y-17804) TaxID=698492 RepID=UPI0008677C9F|nr:uncharacterized protein SAICODRAFT_22782 [Saitoella complicata NRRL Y-17804]ODQ56407.1 hypothetical protein SAICODRAFT_22782 [Saitoella complicata NRRL Y-17804]